MWLVEHWRAKVRVGLAKCVCVRVFDVYVLWLCCSDGGSTETHSSDYCSFVVDNFVNQQFSNRLNDVPGSGSWRFMCEIELVSSPS